jgi:hypothetical protein
MGLAEMLSGDAEPCAANEQCLNRPDRMRPGPSACTDCRYALRLGGIRNLWLPADGQPAKHPLVIAAAAAEKLAKTIAKGEKLRSRDRAKMRIQREAQAAEKRTERNIIRATHNSGRTNRDADHVMAGRITLDTKNQSRLHPIVYVDSLEKVRADARRAGNPIGALVLRNEKGHGFVVLAEEDFAVLVQSLH